MEKKLDKYAYIIGISWILLVILGALAIISVIWGYGYGTLVKISLTYLIIHILLHASYKVLEYLFLKE